MNPAPLTDLIRPSRAAKLLGCHMATVYRLILRGKLRGWRRPGNTYVVSQAEVIALLKPVVPEEKLQITYTPTDEEAAANYAATVEKLKGYGFKCFGNA